MKYKRLLYTVLLGIWTTILLILSFYTPEWMEGGIILIMNDKIMHLAGAFLLGWLFLKVFPGFHVVTVLIGWLLASILFEAFQQVVTHGNRHFDLRDIGMNLTGFGLAYLVGKLVLPTLKRIISGGKATV